MSKYVLILNTKKSLTQKCCSKCDQDILLNDHIRPLTFHLLHWKNEQNFLTYSIWLNVSDNKFPIFINLSTEYLSK